MTDLTSTIIPKSDQVNADDLISGPLTLKITSITACPGSAEQPISIGFEGDAGKPYKPCKSMRRILVYVWGADGAEFVGRSLTIYRDEKVMWGGVAVGGIRISHMSHIDAAVTVALTMTKQSRKPFTVKPLAAPKPAVMTQDERTAAQTAWASRAEVHLMDMQTPHDLAEAQAMFAKGLDKLRIDAPALAAKLDASIRAAATRINGALT